ncbi:hypothetical protein [Rhodopila sp.]|uniref:hypothetical protein n=1 Tax=Rhodopila sp. TaxID=2480087 RepID=UPI003D0CDEA6
MKEATNPTESTERMRVYASAALSPFFTSAANGCETAAQKSADSLLQDYRAATPKEIQLSAQIIAAGLATLACLSAASVAKHDSINEMLRLQREALKLHRVSDKATKMLEARKKQRTTNPKTLATAQTKWDEGTFQLAINQALDKFNDSNARVAAYMDSLRTNAQTARPDTSISE